MLNNLKSFLLGLLGRVRFCRSTAGLPPGTLVFLPVTRTRIPCGLAGIVEIVREENGASLDLSAAQAAVSALPARGLSAVGDDIGAYVGGEESLAAVEGLVRDLRVPRSFPAIFGDAALRERLDTLAGSIEAFVEEEIRLLDRGEVLPDLKAQEHVNRCRVRLQDAAWAIRHELLENVVRVRDLVAGEEPTAKVIREYRKVNLILNAIDRLEIRGRDSAGILFQVHYADAAALTPVLESLPDVVAVRRGLPDLLDGAVSVSDDGRTMSLVYKVAAEVGKLGDNVASLRNKIREDALLRALLSDAASSVLVMAHTRWASNGIINVANCHPLDNGCADDGEPAAPEGAPRAPRVHVALNGDIDNYLELRRRFEEETGRKISDRITTDAKVIALWVDHYLREGDGLETAFRRAVADFEGSAAISMVSDLDPGRLYLSLKGSGQSLYVGLGASGYVVASEIYGLVEETDRFVKLEGERERVAGDASTRGQVFVLSGDAAVSHEAIRAFHHDGVEAPLVDDDLRRAEITTRDVDRGDFPHYFLKEVSQASRSVANTLRGKFTPEGATRMGPETIPEELGRMLEDGRLDRIAVIGQGTAAVAAMAIAAFVSDAVKGSGIHVDAMKASELSGFWLEPDMSRTLVVAVTQSGATADTNRAVDLARERGAQTIAIVNRRNSDITFKTAGVLYTSDGRDVEMSVASTKAFYSQVVAGAVLGLALGRRTGRLSDARIVRELADLKRLPELLDEVFAMGEEIADAAETYAPTRRYWTVVGSGPNRIAAEEVRIKLSELCYKSISADSVEDKKHIDLSSESLIVVLAAGNGTSVLADLAKDVAIFKAHRAVPIVVAAHGDTRFDEYAERVIRIPEASPLLSMVLCTMAGHLFGYHAARAIDEGGKFLGRIRSVVVASLERPDATSLRTLGRFQREYRERLRATRFASALEADTAAELMLLLKYAAGEIPPVSFADEFGREPSVVDIHAVLLECLVEAIDQTIRPVDAIKHQAKIVTVGTSRPSERATGVLFDALDEAGVAISSVPFSERALLTRLQGAVRQTTGMTRYTVEHLDAEGSPSDETVIRAVERRGSAEGIPSRADHGAPLKGTKRSVASDRRAFVGVGAKDGRRIAILPLVDHRFHVNALVLLHLEFLDAMTVEAKRDALGDLYDDIVDGVTEADVPWRDDLLAPIAPADLFTEPPARIAERIIAAA